jgi:hypothetical protein
VTTRDEEISMAVTEAAPVATWSVVPLAVRIPATVDVEAAVAVFERDDATWLGERLGVPVADADATLPRYACDLELGVGTGQRLAFRKSAIVSLGSPTRLASGFEVPIEWRAASFAPLFPVFVGRLLVRPDSVGLDGYYAPPLGEVGVVVDRAVLGLGARRVARWFLTRVAAACA